jgi:hypothetical protein
MAALAASLKPLAENFRKCRRKPQSARRLGVASENLLAALSGLQSSGVAAIFACHGGATS